mgnify:CR=1 FL=1
MSQLKVNSIVPSGGLPSGANGGIIQTIQTLKTDTFSTSSSSFTDITGISATITPSSNSNKILVIVDLQVGSDNDSQAMFILLRGSTIINLGDSSGSRQQCFAEVGSGEDYHQQNCTTHFLDSPSTTSATTYKVQMRVTGSTHHINRSDADQDANFEARTTSSITLMEVSA